jgi:coatomer subunit beta
MCCVRLSPWTLSSYYGDGTWTNSQRCRTSLGPLPLVDTELQAAAADDEDDGDEEGPKMVTRTRITADGTYATESVYTASGKLAQRCHWLKW